MFAALFPRKDGTDRPWLFPLLALILMVVGSISSTTHVGRPWLIMNVLNNPTASLTMEGMSAGALCLVAFIDLLICLIKKKENRAVRIIGGIVGIVMLAIVTMAYTTSYGNPAWRSAPTYIVFIAGGFAVGSTFWALFVDGVSDKKAFTGAQCAMGAFLAVALVWQAAVFAGLEESGTGLIVAGAILAIVATILVIANSKAGRAKTVAVFVLMLLAVCLSRYGFYMASII